MVIAFLHTSKFHVDRFEKIFDEVVGQYSVKHFVNEGLLEYALNNGMTNSFQFEEQINIIKKDNPSLIICTCATYGEESDQVEGVFRIDRPIVHYIISRYKRIGLVFSANSTKKVTTNLLFETAKKFDKKIELIDCDCSKHWNHFENGNQDEYESQIMKSIEKIEDQVDVILLAQASMEGVKKLLSNFSKQVLSSPTYGVNEILTSLS